MSSNSQMVEAALGRKIPKSVKAHFNIGARSKKKNKKQRGEENGEDVENQDREEEAGNEAAETMEATS